MRKLQSTWPITWQACRFIVLLAMLALPLSGTWSDGQAAEPIKVGVLHSLSGTMAISEGPLKEVILMAIDEINADGGVMGRQVEAVVEDPASNWDLFAEKAKKLLLQDKRGMHDDFFSLRTRVR